jgi:soluble P-type ATPase
MSQGSIELKTMRQRNPIKIAIPGQRPVVVSELILDFNGTLAQDGSLLPGVASRLRRLGRRLRITVATADTFGKARSVLKGLLIDIEIVETGQDKLRLLKQLGPSHVVVIGNGRNDVPMMRQARISIAVIGPEGAAGEALAAADVVLRDIREALDLLTNPLRLAATLRP